MHILGILGPWQLIIFLLFVVLPAILIPVIVTSAKRRSKAQTVEKVMHQTETRDDTIEKLEKLNRLRESGGLTEEEYTELKKKLM